MTARRRRQRAVVRAGAVAGLAIALVVLAAQPAAADPPRPTDYRSIIESVEPPPHGVQVRIVGGDAFLEVHVDRGHQVTVGGYQGEPYLRFRRDGTVQRNRHSPATYVNASRKGTGDVPADADPDAEPLWETVADEGAYAWHDHRIHWMQPGRPAGYSPGDVIQHWTVDLTIDGTPTTINGRLVWVDPVSPLPWAALGIGIAAVVTAAGRGWRPRRRGRPTEPSPSPPNGGTDAEGADGSRPDPGRLVAAVAAAMAAVVALIVGWGQYGVAPAGAGANPLLVVVPFTGALVGLTGALLRRRASSAAAAATLAGAAAVLGWGLLRLPVLWKPVLPTDLPPGVDRAGTAGALGLAAAAAALVVLAGGLALNPLPRRPPPA